MSFTAFDHAMMARALQLAARGLWTTSPNPRVGCVIAQQGQVVGEGWHERAGEPHAEVHALRQAGAAARGATAYVSLEPCSHHGRTPPCAEALIAAGVARVIAAMPDPNPQVAGRGLARLQVAGVHVASGLLAAEAEELNIGFVSRMRRGRPWLRVKMAASLDGKTALLNGASQWITGPAARADGHRWRARACAILTGSGTVLADDPSLTVRAVDTERQPLRVVLDARLETPPSAKLLRGGALLVAAQADAVRAERLRAAGGEIQQLPGDPGRVDLPALLQALAARGCNEVHVEAGAGLNGALLQAGLVDEVLIYLAPTLLGDQALGLCRLPELSELAGQRRLDVIDLRKIGPDIFLRARPL